MLLSQFIAGLYDMIPAAKEQIAATGGPKKWANRLANTSGFTITDGPKPGMETIAKARHSTAPPHRCERGVASSSCSSAALAAAPRTSKAPTAAAGKAPAMTPASRVNERPRDLELRLSLDRQASPAEKERYEKLNPGGVFACFKETFELGPKHFGNITFHAGNFSVPLRLIDAAAERAIKELTVKPRWRVRGTALFVRQGSDKQAASPREQYAMPSHGSARPPAAEISEDIAKFWTRLKTALEGGMKVDALKLHEPHSRQLWLACWKAAAAGVPGSGHDVLLKVLLKAAATSNLAPPPLVRGCVLIPQPVGPHLSAA